MQTSAAGIIATAHLVSTVPTVTRVSVLAATLMTALVQQSLPSNIITTTTVPVTSTIVGGTSLVSQAHPGGVMLPQGTTVMSPFKATPLIIAAP